jgi:ribosome maturation factor RimP
MTSSNPLSGIDQDALQGVIEPLLRAHGVEAVETAFKTERNGWVLRLVIEVPNSEEAGGGITLDMCAEVSRDVSKALDVAELIPFAYSLEVSSPGVERPLKKIEDFQRFTGKVAKVMLKQPAADGQRVLRGTIASCEEQRVTMMVDGNPIEFDLDQMKGANLVFEFGMESSKKSGRKNNQDKQRTPQAGKQKAAKTKME